MAVDPIANPFAKQQETKKRNYRFETGYYDLTDADDLMKIAATLEMLANHPYKYGLCEFTTGNKVDGSPYVIIRTREDKDLDEKKRGDIKIRAETFSAKALDDVDKIWNLAMGEGDQYSTYKLLGEKRFAHVILDVCIVLIWAEVKKGSKFMGDLDGIRSTLAARL